MAALENVMFAGRESGLAGVRSPKLAAHFLARFADTPAKLSAEALAVLLRFDWPGSVRELQNALECAALQSSGRDILPEHLPPDLETGGLAPSIPTAPPAETAIRAALDAEGGRRAAAARRPGVSRVALWSRMKRLGMTTGADTRLTPITSLDPHLLQFPR